MVSCITESSKAHSVNFLGQFLFGVQEKFVTFMNSMRCSSRTTERIQKRNRTYCWTVFIYGLVSDVFSLTVTHASFSFKC